MKQDVLQRLRGEYVEMPGLRLTAPQVQRLCGIDDTSCAAALAMLVNAGFLDLRPDGTYVRATEGRFPAPRAQKVPRANSDRRPPAVRSLPTPEAIANRRSADRLLLPPCETCRTNGGVGVVSRTDYVVYFRCGTCGTLIILPKHQRQLGT